MNKGQFNVDNHEFTAKNIKQNNDSLATENSGRTDDGVMHITWVRSNLRKWEIEMPPCTASEASEILSAVQGKLYRLNIWDIKAGQWVNVQCYTSNSSADCYSGVLYNGLYQGITFNAIEV